MTPLLNLPRHKDNGLLQNSWTESAQELNASWRVVIEKWRTVRECCRSTAPLYRTSISFYIRESCIYEPLREQKSFLLIQ